MERQWLAIKLRSRNWPSKPLIGDSNATPYLPQNPLYQILNRLESIWAESGAWPSLIEDMRQTLSFSKSKGSRTGYRTTGLILLPGLCCQAAGGDPSRADELAAAWYLYYVAANLMDKIEDQDQLESWLNDLGTGRILNIASGLYFTASSILNNLCLMEATKLVAAEVIRDINKGFLNMCGGQHRDLVWAEPNLNQFWEIAASKSGSFFSIACSGGARLATHEAARINGFSQFGHHLGILIQLFDDLEDLKYFRECRSKNRWTNLDKTLPFIYAREVLPASKYIRLQKCMQDSDEVAEAAEEVFEIIDDCGTALYINVEIERHREEALAGLDQAEPLSTAGDKLVELLRSITPP